jgi:hypothetical protein
LNSTLLYAATGDYSMRAAMTDFKQQPKSTDWCQGGCVKWQETESGRGLYAELKERWNNRTEKTLEV